MAEALKAKCSRCGAEMPGPGAGGHCLACLLQLGLAPHEPDLSYPPSAPEEMGSTVKLDDHSEPVDVAVGVTIGRYKLLEKVGEGGCGVVYVAEQIEPVRRRVALKVIKLGMDTKAVVARFEAERQALAMMDHPNIAKVLDAGATDAGRPYFVMELVRGIRITDYCDRNQLPTKERLELFIKVCQAIQHAHQKGIIHRDIKPSNILVTLHDGVPVPKVIDFGIAKATEGRLTDATIYTQLHQFIGTPAYMSPEQAEMSGLDIDTRSDIYSLGVLLYELLIGKTPFDAGELMASGLDAMRRTIREKEPLRPSTRLATLQGQELTTTAKKRAADAPRLIHLVRGDLDWIVMKCLEKDRNRRYDTANGLGMDLQRHLNNEPVNARPPRGAYRVRKFVRRNRLVVTATTVVAGALVLGMVVSTWQAIRAGRAERTQTRLRVAAQEAQTREAVQANKVREELRRLSVANGVRLENTDDVTGALLWFAQSLRLGGDPDQERANRLRYASVLQHCPKLRQVLFHTNGLAYATFSPDGGSVYTLASEARVWDPATGEPLTPGMGRTRSFGFCTSFSPDGTRVIAFGADINTVRVYDASTGEPISPPLVNSDAVIFASFSPDGRRLATGGWSTNVLVWDAKSGACVLPPLTHEGVVTRALFSPDGRWILTSSFDGTARVWDAATGRELYPPLQHDGAVRDAVFSPDGRFIATASVDRTARLWDAQTGKPLQVLHHSNEVYHVSFSPDGHRLLTSGLKEARVWNLSTGEALIFKHLFTAGWMRFPLFSPNGKFLITADSHHSARVYDAFTAQPLTPSLPHNGPISHAAFSPDSRHAVTASEDGTARIWDVNPSDARVASSSSRSLENRVAFSPDHRRLAFPSDNGGADLVDARTGTLIAALRHGASVLHVCFSPDGRWLATGGLDGTLRVWEASTGQPIGSPMQLGDWVTFACFSPDSRRLCGVAGHELRIWDPLTGRPTSALMEHSAMVDYAAFSIDGLQLVSACSDGAARVWNGQTGEPITPVFRHEQAVFHASFSPDARFVVTASRDQTARVWDAKTGELVMMPLLHNSAVQAAGFNSSGTRIFTLTAAGVYAWEVPTETGPVEDLDLLAEILGGRQIDSTGSFSELTPKESRDRWQRLRSGHWTRLYPPEQSGPLEADPGDREAAAFGEKLELAHRTAGQSEQTRPVCVDLSAAINLPLAAELPNMAGGGNLPNLPPGLQKLGETEFEIGAGVVQFDCEYFHKMDRQMKGRKFPQLVSDLKVGCKCRNLHFLHARRLGDPNPSFLASYLVHFANGLTWDIPVTNLNLDDVRYTGEALSDNKGSIVAWTGTNRLDQVRLFETSWENPLPQVEVKSIDLVSAMSFYPTFLVAITVE